jgi:succinylarginine dihydrolase
LSLKVAVLSLPDCRLSSTVPGGCTCCRLKTHHAREHSFSAQLRVYASVIIWQRLKKKIQQWGSRQYQESLLIEDLTNIIILSYKSIRLVVPKEKDFKISANKKKLT